MGELDSTEESDEFSNEDEDINDQVSEVSLGHILVLKRNGLNKGTVDVFKEKRIK